VLFDAGILTEQLLQDETVQLVWDSAIAGGWWRFASETQQNIFPEQVGHYWVWRDESRDWPALFRPEVAEFRAKLLEMPAHRPAPPKPAAVGHDDEDHVRPDFNPAAAIIDAEFWRQRHAEFLTDAIRFADLKATWKAYFGTWILWRDLTPEGVHVSDEVIRALNETSRKAIVGLLGSGGIGKQNPWQLWLEVMRKRRWRGFRVSANISVSNLVWEAGVKVGRSPDVVRAELGLSTFDELEADHWLEDLTLNNVFRESAEFCEDLACVLGVVTPSTPPVRRSTAASYPERASWFQNELALREWNVHDLQGQGGPDWKTSRKILDGLTVARTVLEKTAAALSKKKGRVLFKDIPQK